MLTDLNKLNNLWKGKNGWGDTHTNREVFEELYRSFKSIASSDVLTYGHLIPTKSTDDYYSEVISLNESNPIWYYDESSYKRVPIVEKVTALTLTAISNNCKDAFMLLDENGKQIKNIIPFDYSDEGFYNYELKTYTGSKIEFGICDWHLDTNSSILTFNNGVPEGVTAEHPPVISFYRYVGPTGERTYIDAALYDVDSVPFSNGSPVAVFTELASKRLDDIWEDWFSKNKFNGNDTTQGIGLQYNLLTNVINSETGDAVMGWDDNSSAQVASLLSNKKATVDGAEILFVSQDVEGDEQGNISFEVTEKGISKVDLTEGGFIVINTESTGNYTAVVSSTEDIYAVLLVRDNETQAMELYFPREETVSLTIQVPVFVDLKVLPPHLKLKTLSSYSDEITPQYYGPRVADFVIGSYDDTVSIRSADYIVYNKEGSYLSDALNVKSGNHVFLRDGTYKNNNETLVLKDLYFEGENQAYTKISEGTIELQGGVVLEGLDLTDVEVVINGHDTISELVNCNLGKVTVTDGTVYLRDSVASEVDVATEGKALIYGTHVSTLKDEGGFVAVNGSSVSDLYLDSCVKGSVLNTTNITTVHSWDTTAKLDTSYVTEFDSSIDTKLYPGAVTVPFYRSFTDRVYASLPNPFDYDEANNEIYLKLDSTYQTIQINDDGELFCRFFTTDEIGVPEEIQAKIKTQAEEKGYGHEDTVIDNERPVNVSEAIIDLYWSKAGLVKGKIPIDQLPDSVAYGGLSIAGVWSFEEHGGSYPTFNDVDFTSMSDDSYTTLQKGWFWIVKASTHKTVDEDLTEVDDPTYPQEAEDGQSYTAGDWVVFTGTSTTKDEEGNETTTNNFEKVDRAYSDPVYSRLPEKAPNTSGTNLAWSLENGGTGKLELSYKSLAEAIRLINEELWNLSPKAPSSIRTIDVVITEVSEEPKKYIEVDAAGVTLVDFLKHDEKEAYDIETTTLKFGQKGAHDNLPLEHEFYIDDSYTLEVRDAKEAAATLSTDSSVVQFPLKDVRIDIEDPYEKYNLGIKGPSVYKSAEVTGEVDFTEQAAFSRKYSLSFYLSGLKSTVYQKDVSALIGQTKTPLEFIGHKFYDGSDVIIKETDESSTNLQSFNSWIHSCRIGGVPFLTKDITDRKLYGKFNIKNFLKYNALYKTDSVKVYATIDGNKIDDSDIVYVRSVTLNPTWDQDTGAVHAEVAWQLELSKIELETGLHNVAIFAEVHSGTSDFEQCIFTFKFNFLNEMPNIVTVDSGLVPTYGEGSFNGTYTGLDKQENEYGELTLSNEGWRWSATDYPEKYTSYKAYDVVDLSEKDEYDYVDGLNRAWRQMTFKFDLGSIHDLTGFNVGIEWSGNTPDINKYTGALDTSKVKLQVLATSDEATHKYFQDANSTIESPFFSAAFTANERVLYPGKSDVTTRRVTFGRTPVPVQTIFVRVMLEQYSDLCIKNITIDYDTGC